MTVVGLARSAIGVVLVISILLIALSLIIATDPDAWPVEGKTNNLYQRGETYFVFGVFGILGSLILAVLAAIFELWSGNRKPSNLGGKS